MDVYLLFVSAGAICVTLGGIGLYLSIKKRLDELEDRIEYQAHIISSQTIQIREIKKRDQQNADRVYIYIDGADQNASVGG